MEDSHVAEEDLVSGANIARKWDVDPATVLGHPNGFKVLDPLPVP